MSDNVLIHELRKGNYAVFKKLYNHFPIVEQYILKNNGDRDSAKDIFQNTLITFYKKSLQPDFQLTAKISTYLYAIAKNLWLKKLRDEKNKYLSLDEVHESSLSSPESKKENPSLSLKDYLKQKLQQLGEPCKSILVMHTYQKLSMKVITEKMGYANEHTVRQQKYKCLKRIRKLISDTDKMRYLNE